jgi:hypothetical protein
MSWYGYNNVCIAFDTPPATYVMPTFWFFVGYYAVRYAITDSRRVWRLPEASFLCKLISQIADILFIFVAAIFSVCLAIKPSQVILPDFSSFIGQLYVVFSLLFVFSSSGYGWPHCSFYLADFGTSINLFMPLLAVC